MSTDLELRQELLEIRFPAMTIKISSPSSDIANDGIIRSQESSSISISVSSEGHDQSQEEYCCQTPKSPQYMIPKILNCPPAPKKPRRVASCKRKLCEFFEFVAREDVESFFRQFEVKSNSTDGVNKKRCLV